METKSLKSLAFKVLERNRKGNQEETKSFPIGTNKGSKTPKSFPVNSPEFCKSCKHKETIQGVGDGCVYKIEGDYPNVWTLLDTIGECPKKLWN